MRIGLQKFKSTFRLSNTETTTQKVLFTYSFQSLDTPFPVTPPPWTNWVQDLRHALIVCKNHVPNTISSQPLHFDPIPQCPWVSNLAISCPTGLCEPVLLVLTLVCFISNFAVNYLLSLHTAETNLLRSGTSHPCIPLQILQRSLAIVTLR